MDFMDKKPERGFWRYYDRASRVDFGGTLLGLVFDWKAWISTAIGGGGGVVTFLWAAIAERSALDVWVLALLAAAALNAAIYFAISTWEKSLKPRYQDSLDIGLDYNKGQMITPPRDQLAPPDSFDWKFAPQAIEAFAEPGLLAERDKQAGNLEKAVLRRFDAEDKINAIVKGLPNQKAVEGTEEFKQVEKQLWLITANSSMERMTEPYARQAWDKLREDTHQKLIDGRLIAKGFREPHASGNLEVEISSAEWRILALDNVNSTALRNGEVVYSGLVIRSA
jgi:hypothetical protein